MLPTNTFSGHDDGVRFADGSLGLKVAVKIAGKWMLKPPKKVISGCDPLFVPETS